MSTDTGSPPKAEQAPPQSLDLLRHLRPLLEQVVTGEPRVKGYLSSAQRKLYASAWDSAGHPGVKARLDLVEAEIESGQADAELAAHGLQGNQMELLLKRFHHHREQFDDSSTRSDLIRTLVWAEIALEGLAAALDAAGMLLTFTRAVRRGIEDGG